MRCLRSYTIEIHGRLPLALAGGVLGSLLLGSSAFASTPSAGGGIIPLHDFNRDGYDDLAVGIPYATVNGVRGAGAVEVIYGGPKGLHAAGSQLWSLASGGVQGSPHRNDHLGFAVASGDFNADGYDDLVVGVPNADYASGGTTYADAGKLLVLFGSASGLTSSHAQFVTDGLVATGGHAGWALASCDVYDPSGTGKPDGYDDIVVGAPGTGDMTVVSGKGLRAGNRNATSQNVPFGASVGLGTAVACGHVLGRPLADAVFGDPNYAGGPLQQAVPGSGAVFIWRVDGTTPTSIEQSDFNGNPREAGDHFGAAVAVGDVNGDFHDDLLVGSPDEDLAGTTNNGAVSEFFGDGAGSFAATSQVLTEDTLHVPGSPADGDRFGASIALADLDLNLGAAMDMVIGMPGKQIGGHAGAGAIDVLYNAGGGTPRASGNQLFSQDSAGILGSSGAGDHFGARLALGWYGKNDGWDVAASVPGERVAGLSGAGAVSVLYNNGTSMSSAGNQLWTRDTPGIGGAAHAGDHFGQGL